MTRRRRASTPRSSKRSGCAPRSPRSAIRSTSTTFSTGSGILAARSAGPRRGRCTWPICMALGPSEEEPPEFVRTPIGVVAADRAVVVDRPDLLPLLGNRAPVSVPPDRRAAVAPMLGIRLASSLADFPVVSEAPLTVCDADGVARQVGWFGSSTTPPRRRRHVRWHGRVDAGASATRSPPRCASRSVAMPSTPRPTWTGNDLTPRRCDPGAAATPPGAGSTQIPSNPRPNPTAAVATHHRWPSRSSCDQNGSITMSATSQITVPMVTVSTPSYGSGGGSGLRVMAGTLPRIGGFQHGRHQQPDDASR